MIKNLPLSFIFGVAMCAAPLFAQTEISGPAMAGSYWAVQNDWVYGQFGHEFEITCPNGSDAITFTDYPIVESLAVRGKVIPAWNMIEIPNGQTIWYNSYGEPVKLWSAAPDDPVYNYNVEADEYIRMQVDPETGVISWDAPLDDTEENWLRFLMAGKYYFDGYQKVTGIYHFVKVRLYPVNAHFSATRTDGEAGEENLKNAVKVVASGDKALVSGILTFDHARNISLKIDKEAGTFTVEDALLCDDDDYGDLYMRAENSDEPLGGTISYADGETLISFQPFHAVGEVMNVNGGHYENASVSMPFDLLSQITTSGVETAERDDTAAPRYFNLQGVEIQRPQSGFYIEMRGNQALKKFAR